MWEVSNRVHLDLQLLAVKAHSFCLLTAQMSWWPWVLWTVLPKLLPLHESHPIKTGQALLGSRALILDL